MSGNSVLDMAQALKVKSEEKAQLIEKAALNAFHEQEQVIGMALEKNSNSISNAIKKRNERLIKALNSQNLELSNALNELIDTFNTNNSTAKNLLFKSWGITLIGLLFLLFLGSGTLWYQAQMIRDNWAEIAAQNQQKQGLEHYNVEAGKDGDGLYLVLPKKSVITKTYVSDSGYLVVRWGE